MKEHLIPEDARDQVRACVEKEDADKFLTCKVISDLWLELGIAITERKAKAEGWGEGEATGRAHRWFLSSLAADAGLGYQSMLNRQRVGDAIIARGYYGGENENISYQKFVALMANAENGEDGLILKEVLDKRIEWFHNVSDCNAGNPPSVLDITKEFRKNGFHAEWEQYWKAIVRNAKKLAGLETPKDVKLIAFWIVEADDNGYKLKGEKNDSGIEIKEAKEQLD